MTSIHSLFVEKDIIVQNSFQEPLKSKSLIHVFIPAFNESKSIISVLSQLNTNLSLYRNYKISVIDDGSSDNTSSLVKDFFPNVDIIQNSRNRGKGISIQRALNRAHKDEIIVFMDADGEHKPEDLQTVLNPILQNKADLVIGSRFLSNKANKNGSYLNNGKEFNHIRKLGNNLFSLLTYLLYHKFITDTQSGFRAFKINKNQQFKLFSQGFQIEMELTLVALKQKLRIMEVSIENGKSNRGSYMKMILDSLKILLIIIQKRISDKSTGLFRFLYNR